MNTLLAYFDPSAGSLLLQALVGGFGGVVVLGRYVWTQFISKRIASIRVLKSGSAGQTHSSL